MADRLQKIYLYLSGTAALIGGLAVTRSYLSGDKYMGAEEMYGKTVIVTGANSGVGKETARELAKRGARVILACRDMKKCMTVKDELVSQTFNKNVECRQCDLASLKSIKEFVDRFNQEEKFLHVLVNNAGVMWCPKSYTQEGFEMHLGVNHMGHFYLTNLLLPKLVYSSPSRVVVVTCQSYKKCKKIDFDDLNAAKEYDLKKAYDQSKFMNVMFAQELNERLKHGADGVTVNCADPGYVFTDIMRHSSIHSSKYSPVKFFFRTFLKTPEMGAQPVLFTCVSDELKNTTGKYIRDLKQVEIEPEALNKEEMKRLWATSERWTRLS